MEVLYYFNMVVLGGFFVYYYIYCGLFGVEFCGIFNFVFFEVFCFMEKSDGCCSCKCYGGKKKLSWVFVMYKKKI